jgi:hypothetical protein
MQFLPLKTTSFRRVANVLPLTGMVIVAACATPFPAGNSDREEGAALGSLTLSGPTFGHAALRPSVCHSGEPQFFLGFDLYDANSDMVTRLVVDPATGPIVRVFAASAPYDKAVLFHQTECRVLHFSIDSTQWRINRVDQIDVSLELECQLPSGDGIAGKVSAPGCT